MRFFRHFLILWGDGPKALSSCKILPSRALDLEEQIEEGWGGASAATAEELLKLVEPGNSFGTHRSLARVLEGLDSGALLAIFDELGDRPGWDSEVATVRGQVFNFLALADPSLALNSLLAVENPLIPCQYIGVAIRELAKVDFAAARAAVESITEKELLYQAQSQLVNIALEDAPGLVGGLLSTFEKRPQPRYPVLFSQEGTTGLITGGDFGGSGMRPMFHIAGNDIISRWAKKDPAAALAWAGVLSDPAEKQREMSKVLREISTSDPRKVAGMLGLITAPHDRMTLTQKVAYDWLSKDQAGGLEWISSLPEGYGKTGVLSTAINYLGKENPQVAIPLLDLLPLRERNKNLRELARTWAMNDLEGAKSWVTSIENPFELRTGLDAILLSWANEKPAEVARFVEEAEFLPDEFRRDQFGTIARRWTDSDREGAFRWARGLDDDNRKWTLSTIYREWAEDTPEEASRNLAAIDDPGERQRAISNVASTWYSRDSAATMEWIEGLPEQDAIHSASAVLGKIARDSPTAAAAWFEKIASDESLRFRVESHAESIANSWSAKDVEAAAAWAEGLTPENGREGALTEIAKMWAGRDPVEATGWIENLPTGEARDSGIEGLVDQFIKIDLAAAFDWAQEIDKEMTKISALGEVLRDWKKVDAEGAREAFSKADLTPKVRQRLDGYFK